MLLVVTGTLRLLFVLFSKSFPIPIPIEYAIFDEKLFRTFKRSDVGDMVITLNYLLFRQVLLLHLVQLFFHRFHLLALNS